MGNLCVKAIRFALSNLKGLRSAKNSVAQALYGFNLLPC